MDARPDTLEEQTADLGRKLAEFYGDQVAAEYVDVYSPALANHPEALGILTTRRVPLPLIFVNGEPKFVGGISLEMISEYLEKLGLRPLSTPR